MEMHRVANLATFQSLLATFSLQKSTQPSFSLWEWPVLPRTRGLVLSARAHLPLSLSLSFSLSLCLSLSLSFYVSSVQRAATLSIKHRQGRSNRGGGEVDTSPALLETGDSVPRISFFAPPPIFPPAFSDLLLRFEWTNIQPITRRVISWVRLPCA